MQITSRLHIAATLPRASEETIKAEPMLYRADRRFAWMKSGPLTRAFLKALSWPEDDPIIIDSRVHMLMPGMYPCIPGWHHDDIPRSRSDGQPNYETPEYHAEHCLALWGDCSLTEFAVGMHDMPIPPLGTKIYKELQPVVEAELERGTLATLTPPPCRMVYFDAHTWHRGAPTTHTGFRFFIRATRNTHIKPANELRQNANTYMPVLEEGW